MKTVGRRYPLLIYARMINRWWPATFMLGLALLVLGWGISRSTTFQSEPWRWLMLEGAGVLALMVTLILLLLRTLAYVQPRSHSLRIATPFLRFDISYKRMRRVTTSEMHALFPRQRLSGWDQEILAPLMHKTALVVELNGWPLAPWVLRFFLSPFFFKIKDKTPHIILLVDDWLRLNTELDSFRTAQGRPPAHPQAASDSILRRLPKK